jgi:hypothetical protein
MFHVLKPYDSTAKARQRENGSGVSFCRPVYFCKEKFTYPLGRRYVGSQPFW